jgi:hypothetical protein
MRKVFKSLYGRTFGLGHGGELILNNKNTQTLLGAVVTTTITSAQLLALNATARPILAAQGASIIIVPRLVAVHKPAGTAYAGIAAGEDLVLKYTDGSGAQCSGAIETTGFLDQATAQTRYVGMPGASAAVTTATVVPVANAAVVMHMLVGEITTGNSPLHVRMWYELLDAAFTD